jgi:hypothetical protein
MYLLGEKRGAEGRNYRWEKSLLGRQDLSTVLFQGNASRSENV